MGKIRDCRAAEMVVSGSRAPEMKEMLSSEMRYANQTS